MTTDKDRLDWLETQQASISIREIREHTALNDETSILYRRGMRVQLFTVASQHVSGIHLRDAIDTAMRVRL